MNASQRRFVLVTFTLQDSIVQALVLLQIEGFGGLKVRLPLKLRSRFHELTMSAFSKWTLVCRVP